ncbi:MAG TPA: hypothetical protein VHH36_05095, partial [Candidatus Thermoplasmatota archaeon]|nr:hypothetical protein [Candidatus Thermoplasmatota archaeon]
VVDRAEFDAWLAQRSDAAYARLATQIARDAKAGAWINGTVDASGLALDATSFVKGKPIVLNLTSGDGAAHVVTVGDRTLDVPAAGFARLYLPPAGQAVEVRAGNDVETLTEASA